MNKLFVFTCDGQHGDFKRADTAKFLAMTYQDVGPVMWLVMDNGSVVGANPTQVRFLKEEK